MQNKDGLNSAKGVLMFCPTRRQCENITKLLSSKILKHIDIAEETFTRRKEIIANISEDLKDVGGIRQGFTKPFLYRVWKM